MPVKNMGALFSGHFYLQKSKIMLLPLVYPAILTAASKASSIIGNRDFSR